MHVAGISLIERLIVDATGAGFEDITIVVPQRVEEIRQHVVAVSRRRRISVGIVSAEHLVPENEQLTLAALEWFGDEPFVLVVADRVVSPALFDFMRSQRLQPREVVLSARGSVSIESPDEGAGRSLQTEPEHWSLPVRPARCRRIATRALVRLTAKPYDGTVALRINRPVSDLVTFATVSLFPAMTSVHVTLLGFAVAAVGASAFALGMPVVAAILIQLATILDRVDGHVARVTNRPSSFGCFLDPVLDRTSDGLVMIGAGIYLAENDRVAAIAGAAQLPLVIAVSGTALLSHVLVSYTSSKATIELGHWYEGTFVGSGRGRDRRMLLISAGALLAVVEPMSVLVSLVIVTVFSMGIVVTRLHWSWWLSGRESDVAGVRAVVLDFDGTIADSMHHLSEVAAQLLVERGALTQAEATARYLATAGADFRSQLKEIIPGDAATTSIALQFEAVQKTWMPQCKVFPDVVPALRQFSSTDVQVFVCSSTSLPLVHDFCRRNGLLWHLASVDGWRPGHDKAKQVARAVALSGVGREQIAFVGDSARDADTARVNGIRFIGVAREGSPDLLEGTGAYVITSLVDLAREVKRASRSPIAMAPV